MRALQMFLMILCVASAAHADTLGKVVLYQGPSDTVTIHDNDVLLVDGGRKSADIQSILSKSDNDNVAVKTVDMNGEFYVVITPTSVGLAHVSWGYALVGGGDGGFIDLTVDVVAHNPSPPQAPVAPSDAHASAERPCNPPRCNYKCITGTDQFRLRGRHGWADVGGIETELEFEKCQAVDVPPLLKSIAGWTYREISDDDDDGDAREWHFAMRPTILGYPVLVRESKASPWTLHCRASRQDIIHRSKEAAAAE